MMIGHPPPEPPLPAQLIERVRYLENLVRVGLDEYFSGSKDPEYIEACKASIRQYLEEAEAYIAKLSLNAVATMDRVLMDVPVCVTDEETDVSEWFTVVGPDEVDTDAGLISLLSPLGSALLLKRVSETVVLEAPGGRFVYRVAAIRAGAPANRRPEPLM